jgi:hypothetical protein
MFEIDQCKLQGKKVPRHARRTVNFGGRCFLLVQSVKTSDRSIIVFVVLLSSEAFFNWYIFAQLILRNLLEIEIAANEAAVFGNLTSD